LVEDVGWDFKSHVVCLKLKQFLKGVVEHLNFEATLRVFRGVVNNQAVSLIFVQRNQLVVQVSKRILANYEMNDFDFLLVLEQN
jgi:hypothetical protein